MNNIRSYSDLVKERERLQATLLFQKGLVRQDLETLKEELRPAANIISTIGRITHATKDNPLVGIATTVASELLLGNMLLSRGGKAVKLVVPFVAKKIFSLFLEQGGSNIFHKLAGLWKARRNSSNGVSAH
jgi:hypothetical protein